MVRLAILPDGLGGNGSTSCATLALGAATIRQDRLTASSSAFVAQNIAAPSILVFVLAVMSVLRQSECEGMKGKATWIVHGAVVRHHHPCFLMINDDWTFYLI